VPHRAFRFAFIALLSLTAAAGGAYLYLRLSLPTTDGEIMVPGLGAPVEVLRDEHGVPHIFAQSEADAQFALGFVHAQDRLWQLEMNRRIAAGRLAEVLGTGALDTDRFLRTLGIRRVAEANVRHLDDESRRLLAAYAAGVNAFLATRPVLPPEFWLIGVTPEPWSEVDSAGWGKMMAWDLGGNWRSELLRLQLARTLPSPAIQEFLPPYPGDAPVELPELRAFYGATGGSNSWVVSGAQTRSGKPLLANDPHLGLSAPGVWYFAHLHAPGLDAIGATLPGVPGIVIGRNSRLAWATTNTGPDVQDLYLERLDHAARYLAPEGWREFETRRDIIRVKGAPDVELSVRVSRHGPVISDALQSAAAPRGQVLALAWTALADEDSSLAALFRIPRAGNWPEFLAAASALQAPQQNLSYADVDGNIGFVAPGRIPLRRPENALKGLAPAPGWDERYDWAGFIPYEELPRAFNPTSGRIITANQKIVPPGYRHHITSEWQPPYRALRIADLLAATKRHDRASFARMQMDVLSLAARQLLPRMLRAEAKSAAARDVLKQLAAWDGTMAAERAEPLIFIAWWREFARALYADELGPAFRGAWSERAVFTHRALAGQSRWCDDVRTPASERCPELLGASLDAALADLRQRYGADPARWRWGEAHRAEARHRPLTRSWLRRYFDISVPSGGDGYTLNVGRMEWADEAEPFANRHAASLRAIYDLADPEASLFIHPTGQSGNPLSRHYRDLTPLWARGDYIPMTMDRARLQGAQRLVLKPR
jgi:penicillin amidase